MARKAIALLLTVMLVGGLLVIPAAAVEFSDTQNHWAKASIDRWSGEGVLEGYGDGRFLPDGNMSRAELATVLSRIMKYVKLSTAVFPDVEAGTWYAHAILGANAAGVILGDEAGMRPNDKITRQEAIVMLGRALGVKEDSSAVSVYSDAGSIADWAAGLVGGMTKAGFVQGDGGRVNPNVNITRAEAVTILNNAISALYSKAGTYSANAEKNVIVNSPAVVLKDMTVKGDLIIAEGVGDGEVSLDGVKVLGSLIVRGGGENSIIIKGASSIASVSIARKDGKLRVSVEGEAAVEVITVDDGSDDVKIEGTVGTVVVENSAAPVEITGTVKTVTVSEKAAAADVKIASTAKVESISVAAPNTKLEVSGTVKSVAVAETATATAVSGTGKVESVAANANDVSVATPGTSVAAGEGTSGVTAGDKPVSGGTTEETKPAEPILPPVIIPTVSTWDGTSIDTSWYKSDSSSFTLSSAAQLAGLATLVNEGRDFAGKTVSLGINIDLNNKEWTPIGNGVRNSNVVSGYAFNGIFDGNSRTVSNYKITVATPLDVNDKEYAFGLFGCVESATIRNMTVSNPTITGIGCAVGGVVGYVAYNATTQTTLSGLNVSGGSLEGAEAVGGIIGRFRGLSDDKKPAIGVDKLCLEISSCKNTGTTIICSGNNAAGGIAGNIYSGKVAQATVTNCSNSGNVTCTQNMAGGIAGQLIGTLDGGANTGVITGKTDRVETDDKGTAYTLNCSGKLIGYSTGATIKNISNLDLLKNVFETEGGMPITIKLSGNVTASEDITSKNCRFLDFSGDTTLTVANGKTFTLYGGNNNTIRGEAGATLTIAGGGTVTCADGNHFYGSGGAVITGKIPQKTFYFNTTSEESAERNNEIWTLPITTEAGLKAALTSGVANVKLGGDISLISAVNITRPVTIDGSNEKHSITMTNNDSNARVFTLDGESLSEGATVTLKSLNIVGPTTASYGRGINIYGTNNLTLNIVNCAVSASCYAVNIASENTDVAVKITDSEVNGWCALQSWSNGATVSIQGSALTGTNNKGVGTSNGFSTLVLNEGVTGNNWTINNTAISAIVVTQANAQQLVDIRDTGNTVTFDSACSLTPATNAATLYPYMVCAGSVLNLGATSYAPELVITDDNDGGFVLAYADNILSMSPPTGDSTPFLYQFLELYQSGTSEKIKWINNGDITASNSFGSVTKTTGHTAFVCQLYNPTDSVLSYVGALFLETSPAN